jgi:LPS sulfotransferase NodH
MFAEMRTGSNFLEANLNTMDGVTCHGEVFNPVFIGKKDQTELFGISLAEREADPLRLLQAMREQTVGLSGFRYFHDHDPRILDAVMADRRCAKIILTRNPLESYVSWKIAQETGQWKLTNPKNLRSAKARFDGVEFEGHLAQLQAFQVTLLHALQASGQTAFYLDYEDIQDVDVLNGLARYLGVDAQLDAPDSTLKKQNPDEIADKVTNPVAMEQALARMDRFNLSRTPNFEPRRAAAIPGYVAARDVPLLFMPVRGGPLAQVTTWMSSLGGLEQDFIHKTLRQWKRRNPGHRSFTVLRHPLVRAHAAFCDQILSGKMAEVRGVLGRVYKIDLPKPGQGYASAADHRAAFLGFLGFLKKNLSGQTAVRVDASWASQSAVVQGFAQMVPPDALLREDRLAEGLEWLCSDLGVQMPALPPLAPDAMLPAGLADDDVQAAARDAYARDYIAFGFGDYAA